MSNRSWNNAIWKIISMMRDKRIDFQVYLLLLVLFKKKILQNYNRGKYEDFCEYLNNEVDAHFNGIEASVLKESIEVFRDDLKELDDDQIDFFISTISDEEADFNKIFDTHLELILHSIGPKMGIITQPRELSELMLKIADPKDGQSIFNPFAGVASFGVLSKSTVKYYGQEIVQRTYGLGMLRVMAYEKYENSIFDCTDSFSNWPNKKFDFILSNPPFGIRLPKNQYEEVDHRIVEKYIIEKSIITLKSDGKALFILPNSFLSNSSQVYKAFRKSLVERDVIETIIAFPRGILQITGVPFNLMVFSLNKNHKGSIKFIDATSYIEKIGTGQSKKIDVDKILNNYFSNDLDKNSRLVDLPEIKTNGYDLSVHRFINPIHNADIHKRSNSEKIIKLSEIANVIKAKKEEITSKYPFINMTELAGEPSNYVLQIDQIPKKFNYYSKRPLLKEDALLIGTVGGALKPTLFKYDDTPIYLGNNVIALRIDERYIDIDYLISELNSVFVHEQLIKLPFGTTVPHIKESDLLSIAIRLPNKSEQNKLFKEWIIKIANSKFEALNIKKEELLEEEFDLIHDLHHTLKNELTILKSSFSALKKYLRDKENEGKIDLNELTRTLRKGADPKLHDTVNQKITSVENSLIQMSAFVSDYKTLLKFDPKKQEKEWIPLKAFLEKICSEYSGFTYSVIEDIGKTDLDRISENFLLYADKTVFRLVVTNIIENAIDHGFKEKKTGCHIEIIIQDIIEDDASLKEITNKDGIENYGSPVFWVELLIKNNGAPLNEDFHTSKFFAKGMSTKSEVNRGLGGYHIKKGVESMGGYVEIVPSEEDEFNFKISLRFPKKDTLSPNMYTVNSFIKSLDS